MTDSGRNGEGMAGRQLNRVFIKVDYQHAFENEKGLIRVGVRMPVNGSVMTLRCTL